MGECVKDKLEAEALKEDARVSAKNVLTKAYELSRMITEDAYKKAKEISAQIYEYLYRKDELEKTIKAYENILNKYEVEIPFREALVIDEWAEIYSKEEAAQRFKEARENSNRIVKEGNAVVSHYVDYKKRKAITNLNY